MAFCEKADFRSDVKNPVFCEHPGRKVTARPPSRDEGHAVRTREPGVWDKWRGSHSAKVGHEKRDQTYDVVLLLILKWDTKNPLRETSDFNDMLQKPIPL